MLLVDDSEDAACSFDGCLILQWLCQQYVHLIESNGRIVKNEADRYYVYSSEVTEGPPWAGQLHVFDIEGQEDLFVFFRLRSD